MITAQELKGKMVLLHGSQDTVFSIIASTSMKMQETEKVLLIDPDYCMTPRYVSQNHHKKVSKNLEKLFIARPSTLRELEDFVTRLDSLFEKTQIRTVIISSINTLVKNLPDKKAKPSLSYIIKELESLTKKYGLTVIIGNAVSKEEDASLINKILAKKVDGVYAV